MGTVVSSCHVSRTSGASSAHRDLMNVSSLEDLKVRIAGRDPAKIVAALSAKNTRQSSAADHLILEAPEFILTALKPLSKEQRAEALRIGYGSKPSVLIEAARNRSRNLDTLRAVLKILTPSQREQERDALMEDVTCHGGSHKVSLAREGLSSDQWIDLMTKKLFLQRIASRLEIGDVMSSALTDLSPDQCFDQVVMPRDEDGQTIMHLLLSREYRACYYNPYTEIDFKVNRTLGRLSLERQVEALTLLDFRGRTPWHLLPRINDVPEIAGEDGRGLTSGVLANDLGSASLVIGKVVRGFLNVEGGEKALQNMLERINKRDKNLCRSLISLTEAVYKQDFHRRLDSAIVPNMAVSNRRALVPG